MFFQASMILLLIRSRLWNSNFVWLENEKGQMALLCMHFRRSVCDLQELGKLLESVQQLRSRVDYQVQRLRGLEHTVVLLYVRSVPVVLINSTPNEHTPHTTHRVSLTFSCPSCSANAHSPQTPAPVASPPEI